MGEWITVKNRLPPLNKEALFVNEKNQVSIGSMMIGSGADSLYCSAERDCVYFMDSLSKEWGECRYWMPLPQPPKDTK